MAIDIETVASQPKEAKNKNGHMVWHPLKEQIEADKYERAKAAVTAPTATKNPFTMGTYKAISKGPQ